ncbi:MAG: PucR family transcriptional regulator [Aquabacterium sp.]
MADQPGGDESLVRALQALAGRGRRAGAAKGPPREDLIAGLSAAVAQAVPAFSEAADAAVRQDLQQHAGAHVDELGRLLAGGAVGGFGFVQAYARRLAGLGLPIGAALQAYRCMQTGLAAWVEGRVSTPRSSGTSVRNTRPQKAADLVATYLSTVSIVFASEYVAHTEVFAEAEGDRRAELLGILTGGYEPTDARVARLLKRAGYLEQRLSFCVALAQSTDPLEMENPARAQRIADAMVAAVASQSVRVLVGVRSNLVTAVFSDTRRASGWTAAQASLADRIRDQLLTLGPAVLIGLSSDQASTAFIPRGVHEATVALDFAHVGDRMVAFQTLSIRRLLVHRGIEHVQSALPAWSGALGEADAKARGQWVATLRALADADLNVQGAARQLRVHPNTIYARMQRIAELTGLDASRFHDLTQLLLAVDCGRR